MIKFYEKDHIYVSDAGEKWTSVTTLLSKFEPEKDWDAIAAKYAKKNNLKKQDVLDQWKYESDKSIFRGNKYHASREEELSACDTYNDLPIIKPTIVNGVKFSQNQRLTPGVYPELLVFLKSKKISGQADYVEVTADNIVNISDYKTNKELKLSGYVNWEGIEEKMLAPVNHLPNCNFWKYALQINIYMYIILRNNPKLKMGTMTLLHIRFEDESDEVKEVIPYIIPNLQAEVKKIMDSI